MKIGGTLLAAGDVIDAHFQGTSFPSQFVVGALFARGFFDEGNVVPSFALPFFEFMLSEYMLFFA